MRLDTQRTFLKDPWAFDWQSDLTLDDHEGSKTVSTVFDVKYVDNTHNSKSGDVGANRHDFRSRRQQQPGPLPQIFGLLVLHCRCLNTHFKPQNSTKFCHTVGDKPW